MAMLLRYLNTEGHQVEHELGPDVTTIGRAPEATVVVQGEKISRIHCGIRAWESDFVLKDYGSTNGTLLNETRVQAAVIKPGDVIRVGNVRIQVDIKTAKGTKTILRELDQEMEQGGKGYRTMLREIVQSTDAKPEAKAADKPEDKPTDKPDGPGKA
jgi:pSer/pThr/pTyr-binding forkhead associated (FHA) protein